MKVDASAVLRKITEEDRRKIYLIAKKFLQGMTAGQPHHGFDYADFLPRFKKGEFDNTIFNTTSPALTGRYWPWIKEAQVEACTVAAAEAAARLQEIANEAESAAKIAQEEADAAVNQRITNTDIAAQAKAAADMEVRDKLQIAYRRHVQMFAHKQISVLEDIWGHAEEAVTMRHGRLLEQDMGDLVPLKLMPLQRKADSFNDVVWEDMLPPGRPRVVLFDLNFQDTWSATLLQTALHIVGDKGLCAAVELCRECSRLIVHDCP